MAAGSRPKAAAALRIAARSTSSGTPVKSCSTTRATTKGISSVRAALGCQFANCLTCSGVMRRPSQWRSTASSTIRIDTGKRWIFGYDLASSGSEKNHAGAPAAFGSRLRVAANGCDDFSSGDRLAFMRALLRR